MYKFGNIQRNANNKLFLRCLFERAKTERNTVSRTFTFKCFKCLSCFQKIVEKDEDYTKQNLGHCFLQSIYKI